MRSRWRPANELPHARERPVAVRAEVRRLGEVSLKTGSPHRTALLAGATGLVAGRPRSNGRLAWIFLVEMGALKRRTLVPAVTMSENGETSRPGRSNLSATEELRRLGYGGGYDAVRCYAKAWRQQRGAALAKPMCR